MPDWLVNMKERKKDEEEKIDSGCCIGNGGIFASGTHTVIGTVLVRTSNELKASEQQDMEAKLIAALTYVE